MFLLVRTLHILAAVWFSCGVAGFMVTRYAMLQTDDIGVMDVLVGLMMRFKNLMIRVGGILLVIFGLWTAWYESWPRFAISAIVLLIIFVPFMLLTINGSHRLEALREDAVKAGSITPALRAGLRDRKLVLGEIGISVLTVVFFLLMLLKPA